MSKTDLDLNAEAATDGTANDQDVTPDATDVTPVEDNGEPGGVSHAELLAAVSDAGPESLETPDGSTDDKDGATGDVEPAVPEPSKDKDEGHKESSKMGRKLAKAMEMIEELQAKDQKKAETIANLEGRISGLTAGHSDDTPADDDDDDADDEAVATVGTVKKLLQQVAKKDDTANEEISKYQEGYWAALSKEFDIVSKEDLDDLSGNEKKIYDLLTAKSQDGSGTEFNKVHDTGDPATDFLINKQAATIFILQGKKTEVPLRQDDASGQQPIDGSTPADTKGVKPVDLSKLDPDTMGYIKYLERQDDIEDLGTFIQEAEEATDLKTTRAKG